MVEPKLGPQEAGVIGFYRDPEALKHALGKVREAKWQSFDAFTPFPIHGLEEIQGLKRSPLPWVTFVMGLAGLCFAFGLQYWTSAIDWPLNVAGKPYNSWPAFVPVMFELTILFAGISTFAAMLFLNKLPNVTKASFDPSLVQDRFAILIEAPKPLGAYEEPRPVPAGERAYDAAAAQAFLKSLGAEDVRTVHQKGWFE